MIYVFIIINEKKRKIVITMGMHIYVTVAATSSIYSTQGSISLGYSRIYSFALAPFLEGIQNKICSLVESFINDVIQTIRVTS